MVTKGMDTLDAATLQAMLGPELSAEQATLIFQQGQEAVVFALLTLAKQLAQKQAIAVSPDPAAPSGQTPPYVKAVGQRRGRDYRGGVAKKHQRSPAGPHLR